MQKTILITGVTGTLGKALVPIMLRETDYNIVGISRDEQKQRQLPKNDRVTLRLGDVRDIDSLYGACHGYDISHIFHLAALKCVDTLEENVQECIKTNLIGTQNVCNFARTYGARVLFTSTDKAAYPVNTYGMSKALAERAVMDGNPNNVVVRYGNVLGSRGSFLPELVKSLLFKGEANLTSDKMTRFWMTADTVAHFVFNTGMGGQSGLVTPDKIKSSPVENLIRSVARVTGVTDYMIHDVGVRPGEKFHECLLTEFENGGSDFKSGDCGTEMSESELDDLIRPIVKQIEDEIVMEGK